MASTTVAMCTSMDRAVAAVIRDLATQQDRSASRVTVDLIQAGLKHYGITVPDAWSGPVAGAE